MKYVFPAFFEIDAQDNNSVTVKFPDLLGVVTFGENMEDAIEQAKDCLKTALISCPDLTLVNPSSLDKLTPKQTETKMAKLVEVEI